MRTIVFDNEHIVDCAILEFFLLRASKKISVIKTAVVKTIHKVDLFISINLKLAEPISYLKLHC